MKSYDAPNVQAISEERCWQLLGQQHVGRLAVSIANHPDVFPVNYVVHDRSVVIRTAEGQKLAAAVFGASVAFEVDALDETSSTGWSIVLKGQATEPRRLEDYLGAEDLNILPWAGGEKSRYIIIVPSSITGREIPVVA